MKARIGGGSLWLVLVVVAMTQLGVQSGAAEQATAAARAGNWGEAEKLFSDLERRRPLTANELELAVAASGALNHWPRVVELYKSYRPHAPLSIRQRTDLYEALLKSNQKKEARLELSSIVEDRPQDERFAHLLAFLDLSENRFEDALASYERFISQNPRAIQSRINEALVLLKLQRTSDAFRRVREAFEIDAPEANTYLYQQLVRNMPPRGLAELVGDLKSEIGLTQDGARTHFFLAREFESLGRFQMAIEHYEAFLSDEKSDEARLALAKLYNNVGEDQRSEAMLEPLVERPGAFGDQARLLAAELSLRAGRYDRAAELLSRLPEVLRSGALYKFFAGQLASQRNDLDSAIALFEDVIRLDPELSEAYFHLGQAYLRSGRAEEGRNAMQEFQRRKDP